VAETCEGDFSGYRIPGMAKARRRRGFEGVEEEDERRVLVEEAADSIVLSSFGEMLDCALCTGRKEGTG
jgi:hypothetical protein